MRIIRMAAQNIKRIKAVDITPADDVVQITGRNGQGKTSVLDSILYALGGVDALPKDPIRRGETKAAITIDIGEVKITRSFSSLGPQLYIEARDGTPVKQPQTFINSLLDKLSFDPLAFSRRKPAEQAEQLKKLVKLDIDPDELDRANKADYDTRRNYSRDRNALEVRLAAMPTIPAGVPEEPVDVTALTAALEEAGTHNTRIQAMTAQKHLHEARASAAKKTVAEIEKDIEGLLLRIEGLKNEQEGALVVAQEQELKAAKIEIPAPVDTAALKAQVDQAYRDNRWIDQRQQRERLQAEAAELEEKAVALTEAMEARTEQKRRAIEEAKMPIEGLSFEDGSVYYQGFPFEQASGAEQLRISMAIAMAGNPKLRIVRIVDGSLLDDVSMELVKQMARERDFQVWVETVDTTGEVGIVIADGEVESTPQTRAKAPKKPAERVAQ